MKNSSKNNYSGRNRKQQKNNHEPNYFSKNKNSSKKNDIFHANSLKNQVDIDFNERKKNKANFTFTNTSRPINKANLKVLSKSQDINYELTNS